MKKIISIFICILLFATIFSINAYAETPYEQLQNAWTNLTDVAHDIMVQDAINTLAGTYSQYGLTPCEVYDVMTNASDFNSGVVTLNTMVRDKYYTVAAYQMEAYANQLYYNYWATYYNNLWTAYANYYNPYGYIWCPYY